MPMIVLYPQDSKVEDVNKMRLFLFMSIVMVRDKYCSLWRSQLNKKFDMIDTVVIK